MNFPAETVDGVPLIHTFFDSDSATWTYVVVDRATLCACIIDPVLPFDPATDLADADSLRGLADFVRRKAYRVERIIETHVHADHLSGAAVLKAVCAHHSLRAWAEVSFCRTRPLPILANGSVWSRRNSDSSTISTKLPLKAALTAFCHLRRVGTWEPWRSGTCLSPAIHQTAWQLSSAMQCLWETVSFRKYLMTLDPRYSYGK